MSVLVGINPVKKVKEVVIRHHCPYCNDLRNFQEIEYRLFLSLFLIPIFPLPKSGTIFSCVTCGYSINRETALMSSPGSAVPSLRQPADRVVLICPRCEGPMLAPIKEHRLNITCPHCTMEFILKGIKGKIPLAAIHDPQQT